MFESLDIILDFISKSQKSKNINQESLFSNDKDFGLKTPILRETEEWNSEKKLKHEKQLLGLYLTDNPLLKYEKDFHISSLGSSRISAILRTTSSGFFYIMHAFLHSPRREA